MKSVTEEQAKGPSRMTKTVSSLEEPSDYEARRQYLLNSSSSDSDSSPKRQSWADQYSEELERNSKNFLKWQCGRKHPRKFAMRALIKLLNDEKALHPKHDPFTDSLYQCLATITGDDTHDLKNLRRKILKNAEKNKLCNDREIRIRDKYPEKSPVELDLVLAAKLLQSTIKVIKLEQMSSVIQVHLFGEFKKTIFLIYHDSCYRSFIDNRVASYICDQLKHKQADDNGFIFRSKEEDSDISQLSDIEDNSI